MPDTSLRDKGTLLVAQTVKNLPALQDACLQSLGQEDPLEKGMATQIVSLPGKSYGQRRLEGCSPWCHKESDTNEQLTLSLSNTI